MDSQFHMAGEASPEAEGEGGAKSHLVRQQARQNMHRGRTPIYKTIRSRETYSLSQEQHGKTLPS